MLLYLSSVFHGLTFPPAIILICWLLSFFIASFMISFAFSWRTALPVLLSAIVTAGIVVTCSPEPASWYTGNIMAGANLFSLCFATLFSAVNHTLSVRFPAGRLFFTLFCMAATGAFTAYLWRMVI